MNEFVEMHYTPYDYYIFFKRKLKYVLQMSFLVRLMFLSQLCPYLECEYKAA